MLSYLYRCLLEPHPQAPPPSPLIALLFCLNMLASWQATHPIRYNWENSGKCKENMQDGAIVHLMKDGMQQHEGPG